MANAKAGTAYIEVKGDLRPFDRDIDRLDTRTRKRFHGIGKTAALAFTAGGGALLGVAVKRSFSEFQEAERATKQTQAALKSTGKVAGVTAKQIEALANSISLKAG